MGKTDWSLAFRTVIDHFRATKGAILIMLFTSAEITALGTYLVRAIRESHRILLMLFSLPVLRHGVHPGYFFDPSAGGICVVKNYGATESVFLWPRVRVDPI